MSQVNCPSCGGDIPITSKATAVAACLYCSNTLIINEDAVKAIGKMALLADQESCLSVGWSARCLGRDIITRGRLQMKYGAGLWDEWWVQFVDTGEYAWISQDEEEYMLEIPIDVSKGVPSRSSLSVGAQVQLNGKEYFVEEVNEAEMVAVQGELPFEIIPNEKMTYIDLEQDERKASINFFADGDIEAFEGRYLEYDELEPLMDDGYE